MGIEERMLQEAEENISDGTYIIDLDNDKVFISSLINFRLPQNKKHQLHYNHYSNSRLADSEFSKKKICLNYLNIMLRNFTKLLRIS